MSDNKQPREFDFFAEALKAFDVPQTQEEPVTSQPETPISPREEKRAAADVRPAMPGFGKKWWPAILCGIVCIALVISFFPWGTKSPERGEHCVYGVLSVVTDEMLILTDNLGQRWYVELNDQKAPAMPEAGGYLSLWVFYNGEPQETDELNCTKRVTATFLCNARGQTVTQWAQYGWIRDQISFDLNKDGLNEHWLLCDGFTSGVVSYRLVALNEDGTEKYNATVYPGMNFPCVFNIMDGELKLIGLSTNGYTAMTIELKDGKVTLSSNVEQMPNVGPFPVVTVPPVLPEQNGMVMFGLFRTAGGSDAAAETGWLGLSDAQHSKLQRTMNGLAWQEKSDEDVFQVAGYIDMGDNLQQELYFFSHDRTLYHNGECARMSAEEWAYIVELMQLAGGDLAANSGTYYAYGDQGGMITLKCTSSGTFTLTKEGVVAPGSSREQISVYQILPGSFAVIGDYLYLTSMELNHMSSTSTQETVPQTLVFSIQNHCLRYLADISSQNSFDLVGGQEFYAADSLGAQMQFGLYWTDEIIYGGSNAVTAPIIFLQAGEAQKLSTLLQSQNWRTAAEEIERVKTGFFTLQSAPTESDTAVEYAAMYYFTKDGELLHDGKVCSIDSELWNNLMGLLRKAAGYRVAEKYSGHDSQGGTMQLYLYSTGTYQLTGLSYSNSSALGSTRGQSGKYVIVDNVLYLFSELRGDTSCVFLLEEDRVVYNGVLSAENGFDIPDGAVFTAIQAPVEAAPESVVFDFSPMTPPGGKPISAVTSQHILGKTSSENLKNLLLQLDWQKGEHGWPLGTMIVEYSDGTQMRYSILAGNMLACDDGVAQLGLKQWEILHTLLEASTVPSSIDAVFSASHDGKQYWLSLLGNMIDVQAGGESGTNNAYCTYFRIGPVLYCNNRHTGDSFLLVEQADGTLEYQEMGSNLTAWGMPDGLRFVQVATAVDFEGYLDGENYGFYRAPLVQEQADQISAIVNKLEWKDRQESPGSIYLGSLSFVGGLNESYILRSDRTLINGQKGAKLSEDEWNYLILLLAQFGDGLEGNRYIAVDQKLTLDIYSDYTFVLSGGGEKVSGICMRLGYILLCVAEDGQVLTLTRLSTGAWEYRSSKSTITTWELPRQLQFT